MRAWTLMVVAIAGGTLALTAIADDAHGGGHGGGHGTSDAEPAPKPAQAKAPPRDPKPVPRFEPKDLTKPAAGKGDERAEMKPEAKTESRPTSADEALAVLTAGNERWSEGKPSRANVGAARRAELAEKGQKPFATVLTCADSRVPAELLFDQGVGEVFVVRVAGNVARAAEAGTIEYGVEHLGTPVLVVMGHTKCGAVAASASGAAAEGKIHGAVKDLVGGIDPAVERARRLNPGATGDELARLSVNENVWQSVYDVLRGSPAVASMAREGKVKVVGAVYDIASGKVQWLGEHPWQAEILAALAPAGGTTAAVEESH